MKLKLPFELNKDTISLSSIVIIVLTFFITDILDVLDYVIFKVLIIGSVAVLVVIVSVLLFKSHIIQNRPEEKPQDDSN